MALTRKRHAASRYNGVDCLGRFYFYFGELIGGETVWETGERPSEVRTRRTEEEDWRLWTRNPAIALPKSANAMPCQSRHRVPPYGSRYDEDIAHKREREPAFWCCVRISVVWRQAFGRIYVARCGAFVCVGQHWVEVTLRYVLFVLHTLGRWNAWVPIPMCIYLCWLFILSKTTQHWENSIHIDNSNYCIVQDH